MMRPVPDATAKQWLNEQLTEELWLNSIVVAELLFGVARMPEGTRKQRLIQTSKDIVEQNFAGRILSFDLEAAAAYAEISARCMAKGRPIDMADAQIAAICWVQDAKLATRNTKHFEGLGLKLINPWH
jgi:toxin FitB